MVENGATFREAADAHSTPLSTLHDVKKRQKTSDTQKPGRWGSLSSIEEETVVAVFCGYADRGIPMHRKQLQQAIENFVGRMTPSLKLALQFRNGSPGTKYLR